ncbi:uncharacterized protein LOC130895231 isoform X3 [Diorhabda carinulata]|uniref:uncharacterized protein LOC130895231 isoform X3 n=1 Tax=Diorhabda carinulata TaxID=1163345 RepID=UPI0025A2890A|nr:uncharacterized protein LOC130895231 isoform X3 [Diorhabda carinulata]
MFVLMYGKICKMPSCTVKFCKNHNKNTRNSNVHYHRFPQDSVLREIWRKACGVEELKLENARICSDQFNNSCYEEKSPNRSIHSRVRLFPKLKKTAVPMKNIQQNEIVFQSQRQQNVLRNKNYKLLNMMNLFHSKVVQHISWHQLNVYMYQRNRIYYLLALKIKAN